MSDENVAGQEAEAMKVSDVAQPIVKPTLPEGLHYDEVDRIFNDAGEEFDAAFNLKQPGIVYDSDNLPMDLEAMGIKEKLNFDPTVVAPGTITVGDTPIPVSFTETRKDKDGNDFVFHYPEIRKDDVLLTHILTAGHVPSQNLVNCKFEDGTYKHVSVEELAAAGYEYKFGAK